MTYELWTGPSYRAASRAELLQAAFDQPMSQAATFWDQAKGGALESFGLGTAIREFQAPDRMLRRIGESQESYERRLDEAPNALNEDEYKASPFFRTEVPWDQGMTEERAAALADMYDRREVREFFAEKRPITSFLGNLAGQAVDPINYIPVAGQVVRAANIARFGRVAGTAVTASLDAAANTALAGLATRETRRAFGDDVSWQAAVSEIAMAALIGGAFGTVGGILGRRADTRRARIERDLSTLRNTQEARIALNEAIDGLVHEGEVRLSPNGTSAVGRVAREVEDLNRAYDTVHTNPTGPIDDPLVAITPDDIEGTFVGRGSFRDVNEADVSSKRGRGLVKIIWGHGEKSREPDEFKVAKDDVIALPSIIREYEPSSVSADGRAREWRVDRNGRTLVYADSLMPEGRHVVTTYVQKPDAPGAETPLSKKRPVAAGSFREAGNPLQDTASPPLPSSARGRPLPASANIARSLPVDNTAAASDPIPSGRAEAETSVAKPESYKALADQYRVDPETGTFPEQQEIALLVAEGRMTADDAAAMESAQSAYEDSAAYGEALKSLVSCVL